jgi:hypothetical protein
MITSASEDASQPTASYDGGLAVLYALGRFGRSLIFLMLGISFVLNGASLLGLMGQTAHLDISQHARWRAAVFLVLGGVQLTVGLFTFVDRLKEKAA